MAKPTGWDRFKAKLTGQVPAAELEAYRRAASPVFDLMEEVERRRLACGIEGLDPWTVPPATRAAFLCAWNAFVLQTLANDLVDADYAHDPGTPGFVPPVTAAQALRFFEEVEGWVRRGWQAAANPAYGLDVSVPAPLPPWLRAGPVPPAHLHGLLRAMRSVNEHADAALSFLPSTPPDDTGRQAQLNRIRQLHASARVSARYAEETGVQQVPGAQERAAEHARSAIQQFYLLGQLVADPALAREGAAREPQRSDPKQTAHAPAPERPPRPRAPKGPVAALSLATRRDEAADQTITEPAVAVEFMATLRYQAGFALRPALVSGRDGIAAVLRVEARSAYGPAGLTESTITVHMDGREVKLHPLPDKRSRVTAHGVHEESASFALPAGMLEEMGAARRLWLRMQTWRASLHVEAKDSMRLGATCRAFHEALWTARD
jgi:hypothetical protein